MKTRAEHDAPIREASDLRTRSMLASYGVAAGTVLLALALRWPIHDLVRERMPFVFFSAAIAVTAWHGQWRAGLFATLLSTIVVKLLLIEPVGLLTWTTGSVIAVGGYVGTGLIIVGALQAMHAANGQLRLQLAERSEAEEALRRSEQGLRERVEELDTLMNILPVGVWIGNRDCSIITGNPEAYRITGLPQGVNVSVTTDQPEVPAGLRIFIDGKEVQQKDAPMQQVARTAKAWQNIEQELRFPDGTAKTVYGSVAPLFDEHGQVRKVIGAYADFTERKRAEDILRHRSEQFETLVNRAPFGVYLVDADFRIVQVNPVALPVFGDIPGGVLGRDFGEIIRVLWDKKYADEVVRTFRHTLETGESHVTPERADYRIDRKKTEYYEWRLDRIPLPDGRFGLVCYFRDTSRQVEARKMIEQSQQRLHGIISSARDAVITIDAQQRIVLFNPAAEKVFALSAKEAIGRPIEFLIPERFRASHAEFVNAFGQTGVRNRKMGALGAISGLRGNGEEFPVEASISQIQIDGEQLFTVILRDITERKKAEERQGRLAAIVEYSRDAVISKSLDGIVTSWNPGAETLFGYTAAEMIGRSIREIIPPDHAAEADMILVRLRAGQSTHLETVRLTKQGQRVPVSITCSPIKDAAGRVIAGSKIARDITEEKYAEDKLREAQQKLVLHAADLEATVAERTVKLREAVNELQSFSYSIAHDMRAPLRAMGTFAQMLLDEASADGLSSASKDYAQRIITGAGRLDSLINDALNYTKAVLQEFPLQPVDLAKLVRGIVDTYPNLHSDNADIRIEGTLPTVLGNESLLTQCISNLLGNAVKFVVPGTRPQVRVWSEINDGVARVWVVDTGIGIPKHAQPRLFAMFQKLDNQYEGTGIGLAIVRKVVVRMGGKVGVESEPGQGSRFWVELLVAPRKEAA